MIVAICVAEVHAAPLESRGRVLAIIGKGNVVEEASLGDNVGNPVER
jgi:hypothetical protein